MLEVFNVNNKGYVTGKYPLFLGERLGLYDSVNVAYPDIEELYQHPGKWAEYPEQVSHSATMYRIKDRFADIELALRGGNNLAIDHPDKKLWTVYVRYMPATPIVEEELI